MNRFGSTVPIAVALTVTAAAPGPGWQVGPLARPAAADVNPAVRPDAAGLVRFGGRWFLYHGAADSLVGVAVCDAGGR